MRLLRTIIILFWIQNSFAQTNPYSISADQALEDLNVLEITLREIHPNIYRYTSKIEFERAYKNVRDYITATTTVNKFYNKIAPILALVHCGHTIGIPLFTDDKKGLLPLDVKILDNKLFILRNLSSTKELVSGSEINEINGISATAMLQDFRNKSIADGYALTFKDRTIERDFKWKLATFINQPDSFKITFSDNRSYEPKELTLAAQSSETIAQTFTSLGLPLEKPLDFFIDKENDVAVLKLRTFMAQRIKKQSGQHLKHTIRKSFKEIRKSKTGNLVIDIRWNTGGKAYAPPLLFSYLTDKPFKFKRKLVFRHGYKFSYPQYLNRNKFEDWVNQKLDKKINDSTFEWTHHKNTRKAYKPNKSAFLGNLYIVANGMTASSGAEFASLLSANGRGIFVGEETGGDYNGVNGYERTYLVLPNSKIGVLIPGRRSIMAWDETKNIGHGVIPDYKVQPTIKDLLSGQDTEMKFVYELIRKN